MGWLKLLPNAKVLNKGRPSNLGVGLVEVVAKGHCFSRCGHVTDSRLAESTNHRSRRNSDHSHNFIVVPCINGRAAYVTCTLLHGSALNCQGLGDFLFRTVSRRMHVFDTAIPAVSGGWK